MKLRNRVILAALTGTLALAACKRDFGRMIPGNNGDDQPDTQVKEKKVLLVIVNGARGLSVRDAKTPAITALTANATYSWYSLSDAAYNNGTTLTDMLTGVGKEKHRVVNDAFDDENLVQYPTVIRRIKDARPDTRIAAFASSSLFIDQLTVGADTRAGLATDAEVKQGVVQELANEKASVVIGQFNGVDQAGAASGYDLSFPAYKQAIVDFDQSLAEMVSAVKARKTYQQENWLIIVSSNKGGDFAVTPGDNTIFSNGRVNTFTIFSNISYGIRYIDKPYTGNRYEGSFVRLNSSNDDAIRGILADTVINKQLLNFGDTTSFTIEFKVKKENRGTPTVPNYDYTAPGILSKKATKAQKTGTGWVISLETKGWQIGFGKPSVNSMTVKGADINDGNWHSLAVVVSNKSNGRSVRTFTDGNFNNELILPLNWGAIDEPAGAIEFNPLTLGFIPGETTHPFNGYISELKIWLAAIPDATVKQFTCDPALSPNHPFKNRLAGYWPCKDGAGGKFRDNSATKADFVLMKGDIPLDAGTEWKGLVDLICPTSPANLAGSVPSSKDITLQMLSWLAIPPADTWKLDGRVWLNQ
ncbi:MAG TPA: LamG-like jellyroll fold domain-containing protein [Pseudobacter sp.]|nr:LamG-like jellyroll fold domain-containing protein [Pseudobacter sp.]